MADPETIGGLAAVGALLSGAVTGFFSSRKRGASETKKITGNETTLDAHEIRLKAVEEQQKEDKKDAQQLRAEVHDGFQALARRADRTDESIARANRGIDKLMDRLIEDTSPGSDQ